MSDEMNFKYIKNCVILLQKTFTKYENFQNFYAWGENYLYFK